MDTISLLLLIAGWGMLYLLGAFAVFAVVRVFFR